MDPPTVRWTCDVRAFGACWAATVLLILLCACTADTNASSSDLPNADAVPALGLVAELRIGSLDDPDYGFSWIGDVAVDRDGNAYVFESQDRRIRVYSADGQLLRTIGGPGEGPGEFSFSVSMGVTGDTVWTVDDINRRLTLFNRRGEVLEARVFDEVRVQLNSPGRATIISPRMLGSDGMFIGDQGLGMPSPEPTGSFRDTVWIPRVRFSAQGKVVDTIGSYPLIATPDAFEFKEVGSSRYMVPPPPRPRTRIVRTVDGRIEIDPTSESGRPTLRITRIAHSGDTVRTRLLTYEPNPYPDEVLDERAANAARSGSMAVLTETGVERLERRPQDSAAAHSAVRAAMAFPEEQPPVQGTTVTADGTLWLRREDLGGPVLRWTVLDRDDTPTGEVEVPRQARIAWIGEDMVWMVERDSLDVPWLVRYRLTGGGG
jgi:hypothetical protein